MYKSSIHQFFYNSILTVLLVVVVFEVNQTKISRINSVMSADVTYAGNKSKFKKVEFHSLDNQIPTWLQLLTLLIGNDWLGADWLYIGIPGYRYPDIDTNKQIKGSNPNESTNKDQSSYTRFWVDPGPALIRTGDILWVWGYEADSHELYADSILVNPTPGLAPPDDTSAYGKVFRIIRQTIQLQDSRGIRFTVSVDPYTTYNFPDGEGLPRPQEGHWLNISWLTGSTGMLGDYANFNGKYKGILRFDFSQN